MAKRRKKSATSDLILLVVLVVAAAFGTTLTSLLHSPILLITVGAVLVGAVFAGAALYRYYRRRQAKDAARALSLLEVQHLDGVAFERYISELLRAQGYQVEFTKASGDLGVDLIAQRDRRRIAIQAKRYAKPVDQKAVREAIAGREVYGCTESMVITNSSYTKSALALAAANTTHPCRLIAGTELADIISAFRDTPPSRSR